MSHQRNDRCVEAAGVCQNDFHEALIPLVFGWRQGFAQRSGYSNQSPKEMSASRALEHQLCKAYGGIHQNSSTNFSTIGEISALRRLVSTITLSLLPGKRSTLVENPQVLP